MTQEIRNLKGDVVQSANEKDAAWWHLSSSTWFLIGGLILFNIGSFFNPLILNPVFAILRIFDVRFWSWYFVFNLLLLLGFSIKCYQFYMNWDDYDTLDKLNAKCFINMSVSILIVAFVILCIGNLGLFQTYYRELYLWFRFGTFTWTAGFAFSLIFLLFAPVFYFTKEWILSFWNE